MITLNLGVFDIPRLEYVDGEVIDVEFPLMMGELADSLEKRYQIFSYFWQIHKNSISQELMNYISDDLFEQKNGKDNNYQFSDEAFSYIKSKFVRFLEMKVMDHSGIKGIPTLASLIGINRRLKGSIGPPRPSFIDTAQYMESFVAWVD